MRTVAPADESMIRDPSEFSIKTVPDFKYPLYLEKRLEYLWGKTTIDLAGWAAFKRLVLLDA